ncbi:hypothetical protein D9758_018163 [Tetrapyrgos nigripes]|uniref:CCHC-type domain-containing protein n=1 Tax=Tetrapyrgos nigripes TaxID=182062 RepID=A0A8H5BSK3_9AGAR|nr:hypothetical protein D9758_018163 [Tetrapyrgos nigripes]
MNNTLKINYNGTCQLSTQEIVNLLRFHYLFLHPELPSWTTIESTKKLQPSMKPVDLLKDPKNVALQAMSLSTPGSSTEGKKLVLMDVQCYNCKRYGHMSCECPTPRQLRENVDGNGKKSRRWKGKGKGQGNASNIENTPATGNTTNVNTNTTPVSTPSQSQSHSTLSTGSLKATGQASMVEQVDYIYMAEPLSDND